MIKIFVPETLAVEKSIMLLITYLLSSSFLCLKSNLKLFKQEAQFTKGK